MKFFSCLAVLGFAIGLSVSGASFAASFQDMSPAADGVPNAPSTHTLPDLQKQIAKLTRKLQLTPDQLAKIEPILRGRQQQIQQLRGDNSLSPQDQHQKLRSLKQDTEQRVLAILSGSQRQQYLLMLQKALQKRHDKKHDAPTDGDADDDGSSP